MHADVKDGILGNYTISKLPITNFSERFSQLHQVCLQQSEFFRQDPCIAVRGTNFGQEPQYSVVTDARVVAIAFSLIAILRLKRNFRKG